MGGGGVKGELGKAEGKGKGTGTERKKGLYFER